MAQVARTPAERQAVSWPAVITEANAGITSDFAVQGDWNLWYDALKTYASGGSGTLEYPNYRAWGRLDVRYIGPADTIGNYQAWLALPLEERNEILIETPDRRVTGLSPTDPGSYVKYWGPSPFPAARGLYHYSYYADARYDFLADAVNPNVGPMVEMSVMEMEYLKAEGMYWTGNYSGAEAIVNYTRENNGELPPITAPTGPTDPECVPRTETGTCGDFWDALKYEKRLEVYHTGLGIAFFDDRGWGDLVANTFQHLPIPGQELEILGLSYYTFGGPSWPAMVAGQTTGPMKVDPEVLSGYWAGLRARLDQLEEETGPGPEIVKR
jgi:hypothetical protein